MGPKPFIPHARAFLEAMKPHYAASTHKVISRGLRTIGRGFSELRSAGMVSTTNPQKMTQADIEAFLRWMKERRTRNGVGLKQATQANYMEYLAALLLYVENPVMERMRALHYIRFPQKISTEIRTLSEANVEQIRSRLKDMPGWNGAVARFIVPMYAYSGLRRSELRRARLQDLDIDRWKILVVHPKGEGRYASDGTAPILPPARQAVIDFLKAREDYLKENRHCGGCPRPHGEGHGPQGERPGPHGQGHGLLEGGHDPHGDNACHRDDDGCGKGTDECEPLVPRIYKDGRVDYWTDGMWGALKDETQRYAGIPFRIQYLRATFGQMAKDRGASIEAVSRALRHRTTKTTELYYARIRPENAFRELEEAFADKP